MGNNANHLVCLYFAIYIILLAVAMLANYILVSLIYELFARINSSENPRFREFVLE